MHLFCAHLFWKEKLEMSNLYLNSAKLMQTSPQFCTHQQIKNKSFEVLNKMMQKRWL